MPIETTNSLVTSNSFKGIEYPTSDAYGEHEVPTYTSNNRLGAACEYADETTGDMSLPDEKGESRMSTHHLCEKTDSACS